MFLVYKNTECFNISLLCVVHEAEAVVKHSGGNKTEKGNFSYQNVISKR